MSKSRTRFAASFTNAHTVLLRRNSYICSCEYLDLMFNVKPVKNLPGKTDETP